MIHYHGLPITPNSAALAAVGGGHAFVSFAHPDQAGIAIDNCQSFAVDNGAFSAWRSGNPVECWKDFYEWAEEMSYIPNCDFVVIPDVIDGDLNDQTRLMAGFLKHFGFSRGMKVGAPVFHMHEPLDHAAYLSRGWARVCIGSSGEYSQVGSHKWWVRMNEIMSAMCDKHGRPNCKIHGLRMLDPDIFTRLPLASADSTNVARNIGIDSAWKGTYTPSSKDVRAIVIKNRIEQYQSAQRWEAQFAQQTLFCSEVA